MEKREFKIITNLFFEWQIFLEALWMIYLVTYFNSKYLNIN